MEDCLIIGAYRSPVGRFLGNLSTLCAPRLASVIIKEGLKRAGIRPSLIDEVILGNVVSAGIGQNPARQAALYAGLPRSTAAFTVNKVCASGLKAVSLAAQAVMTGDADIIVAGGMESMSNAPFLLKDMRGKKYGAGEVADSMLCDGLIDRYSNEHMGGLCELTAKKFRISRKEQDEFALNSHKKAAAATKKGFFKDEIIPVPVASAGVDRLVDADETIRWDTEIKKLSALRPAFKAGGTITAGNSPGLNDGAAIVIISSRKKAEKLGIRPLARIIGYSSAHLDPEWYTLAPVLSVRKLLKKTGLKLSDFDLIEENEAFAAQTIAVIKELGLDPKKVNVNGGAIALGHPIGSSGARVLVTLAHALRCRNKRLGLATLCLGGGGAMSMAVEAVKR